MNFRTTSILFGVLIAMLMVFGIVVEVRKGSLDEGFLFPTIQGADLKIETVELWRDGKKYLMTKGKAGWTMKAPGHKEKWRLDENQVTNIISQVQSARKNEQADVVRDEGAAGLSKPAIKVLLISKTATGQKNYTLYVGKKSADDANVFVKSSERPRRIAAVEASDLSSVFVKDINKLRDTSLLKVTTSTGQSVSITEPGDKKKLVLDKVNGKWVIKSPDYGRAADVRTGDDKDLPSVNSLLDALSAIHVADVKDFEDLGKNSVDEFGVTDKKATLIVNVTRAKDFLDKDTVKETLYIGDKAKEQYFVRLSSDDYVVRVNADKIEPLLKAVNNPASLRSHDLAFYNASEPDALVIRTGKDLKEVVTLGKTAPDEWKMKAGSELLAANKVGIDGDKGLLETLQGTGKIKKFFDAKDAAEAKKLDAKLGFDSPRAEVAIYLSAVEIDNADGKKDKKTKGKKEENSDEKTTSFHLKKDAKAKVKLIFGKAAKDIIYVKRVPEKGEVSRLSVPYEVYEKTVPASEPFYLAFLKEELPPFAANEAVKIELTRGSEKFVLEKKSKGKKDDKKKDDKKKFVPLESKEVWKLLQPTDLPGGKTDEFQIRSLLDRLNRVDVTDWVKKVSPKDDLSRFGLKDPAAMVTLQLKEDKDKKGKSRTYKFGKSGKAKDKKVYALVSGTDIVFETGAEILDFLEGVELRDRTIFTFDADKVREVEMKWRLPKGFVITLEMKRTAADAEWTVAKLEGFSKDQFELDTIKLTLFIRQMANLQTNRYVSFKGADSKHKLADKDAPLSIRFKLEGEKEAKTLTVGAEDKEKTGYYAKASTLANAVFLVDKLRFESVLEGVRFFNARLE